MEPTSGHWEKDFDFDSILKPLGLPRGSPWGSWWYPFSPLDPSQGGPKEPEEPILSHLGRVPFWTLILDPNNHKKKLNFEGARTLKIELSPARECNFHMFTSFLSEP